MTKRIKVQLYQDGSVQVDIQGIKGKKCTEYIQILEELLEAEAVDSNYTEEYYEDELVVETEKLNLRRES